MGRAPINITYSLPFLVRFHHHDQQHHRHTNDNVIWRGFSFRISRRSCHCVPPTDLTRIFGRGLELSCITTICLSVYMSTCCPHAMPATSEPGSATPKSPLLPMRLTSPVVRVSRPTLVSARGKRRRSGRSSGYQLERGVGVVCLLRG